MKHLDQISLIIWEGLSWSLVFLLLIESLHSGASSLFLPLGFFLALWIIVALLLLYRSPQNIKLALPINVLTSALVLALILFAWRFWMSSLQ